MVTTSFATRPDDNANPPHPNLRSREHPYKAQINNPIRNLCFRTPKDRADHVGHGVKSIRRGHTNRRPHGGPELDGETNREGTQNSGNNLAK